jgi:hypothetical protein
MPGSQQNDQSRNRLALRPVVNTAIVLKISKQITADKGRYRGMPGITVIYLE